MFSLFAPACFAPSDTLLHYTLLCYMACDVPKSYRKLQGPDFNQKFYKLVVYFYQDE
jgi:hypothetical protein